MANLIAKANESKYADKGQIADNNIHFCVSDVELTDGEYGERWELEIFLPEEELKTISFTRTEKRDALFESMMGDLPQHDCWLVRWSFKGKSGYRLDQRSGGGPCACTPELPSIDPFLPDFDAIETPVPKPEVPQITVDDALDMNPPSPAQLKTIKNLCNLLEKEYVEPMSWRQADSLVKALREEYKAHLAEDEKAS